MPSRFDIMCIWSVSDVNGVHDRTDSMYICKRSSTSTQLFLVPPMDIQTSFFIVSQNFHLHFLFYIFGCPSLLSNKFLVDKTKKMQLLSKPCDVKRGEFANNQTTKQIIYRKGVWFLVFNSCTTCCSLYIRF